MLKLNEAKFVCVILNTILFCQTDNVYLNENTCPLAFIFQIQKERIRNLCEFVPNRAIKIRQVIMTLACAVQYSGY